MHTFISALTLATSNIIIPVESENTSTNKNTQALNSNPEQALLLQQAQDKVLNPTLGTINATQVQIDTNTTTQGLSDIRSTRDIISRIKTAHKSSAGGEGASTGIRFRGVSAFDPSYYFETFPLNGSFSGSQNIDLFPAKLITSLNAWPDAVPWYMGNSGIAGGIGLGIEGLADTSPTNSFIITPALRIGSFGYRQISTIGKKDFDNYDLRIGAEYTTSKENYPITNDNGTPTRTNDDFQETRTNADFTTYSGGIHLGEKANVLLGKWWLDILTGFEERGLPGYVGNISPHRLTRSTGLISLREHKILPGSGIQINTQAGLQIDNAQQNLVNYNNTLYKKPEQQQARLGGRLWLSIPISLSNTFETSPTSLQVESPITPILGFGISGFQTNFNTKNLRIADESLTANRTEIAVSAISAITKEWNETNTTSLSLNGNLDFSHIKSKPKCPTAAMASTCPQANSTTEPTLNSSTLSLQQNWKHLVAFARGVFANRRPWLMERYGSPGGNIANTELVHEKSKKIEAGLTSAFGEALCYIGQDRDLIALEAIDSQRFRYSNFSLVKRKGCTFGATTRLLNYVNAETTWLWTDAKIANKELLGEKILPRTPKHSLFGKLSLVDVPLHLENLHIKSGGYIQIQTQSKFFLDAANRIELILSPTLDTGIGLSLNSPKYTSISSISLSFEIRNILDSRTGTQSDITGRSFTVEHTGFAGFPVPGRRYYAGIQIPVL